MKNTETGVTASIQTSGAGFYLFPGVTPGSYELSVQFKGMQRETVSFEVQVAQSVVIDPVLKPGATTTTVDVTAAAPLVTLDNYSLRQGLERARIQEAA
jgi:hypothetical protein